MNKEILIVGDFGIGKCKSLYPKDLILIDDVDTDQILI